MFNIKSYPIILIVLFIPLYIFSQNIEKYYNYTNEAELYICDAKYKKANKLYCKAFKVHKPFMIDRYNAWIASYLSSDKKLFKKNFDHLLQMGISKKYLVNSSKLNTLKSSSMWTPYYQEKLEKYDETKNQDTTFIQEIQKLVAPDQSIRKECPYYSNNCIDSVKLIDSINFTSLLKTLEKYSYPKEINGLIPNQCLDGIYLVISHNISWNRYWADSILISGAKKGKIHSRKVAFWLSKLGQNAPNRDVYAYGSPLIIDNHIYFPKPNKDSDLNNAVQKNRDSIFLCNYNEYIKKIKFDFFDDNFIFYSSSSFPRITGLSHEEIEKEIKPYFENPIKIK